MDVKTVKNYLYNVSYQVLMVFTPLITAPYISRVLHANGVGIYSYTFTIATAFSLFAALGINTYGQREIAYCQDDIKQRSQVFWELLFARFLTTVLVCLIYIVFCFLYKEYTIYLLLQIFLITGIAFDISWFYQGIEDFRIIAIRNIFIKLFTLILIFIIVKTPDDLWKYILINSLSTLLSYLLFFMNLDKLIIKVELKSLNFKRHIRGTIEFFIPLIATQLYSQLDKIMLGILTNNFENGYYEQARKIVNILILVLTSINSVMYPRVSNLYAKNEINKIKNLYQESLKIIFLLLVPMVIGLLFVSDDFVLWFFGDEYAKVSILMKLSGFLLIFMTLGNFVGMQYLSPSGKQNKMTIVYIISAIINLILNMFLIKKYLSVGAIIASIVAEFFSCFIQIIILQKSEFKVKLFDGLHKYLIAGVIMGVGLYFIQRMNPCHGIIKTFIEVACGALIYVLILIIEKEKITHMFLNKLIFKLKH